MHIHKYTIWNQGKAIKVFARGAISIDEIPIGQVLVQQKTCKVCGKVKFRKEKI